MRRLACIAVGLWLLFSPGASGADPLETEAEFSFGVRLYDLSDPFDDDALASILDQYHHIRHKDSYRPYFVDLVHSRFARVRPDGTRAFSFERWSPNPLNDRSELSLATDLLSLDVDFLRYRWNELREYPMGTGTGIPVFGETFTPDGGAANPLGLDRRTFIRRNRFNADFRAHLDRLSEDSWIRELRVAALYENRDGFRQDRFLLDEAREPVADPTARFRGFRRDIDQSILGGSLGLVSVPLPATTAHLEFGYEALRRNSDDVLQSTLAGTDPLVIAGGPLTAARAYQFVPETDRWTGRLGLSGRLGKTAWHAGGGITRLDQTGGRAPLQELRGLGDNALVTQSAYVAVSTPLLRVARLRGHLKMIHRRNENPGNAFQLDPGTFGDVQVDPFLRRRAEYDGKLELSVAPRPGTYLRLGFRENRIDRNLRFSTNAEAIDPSVNLIEGHSTVREVSLRARQRLGSSASVTLKGRYRWSPQVSLPRSMEEGVIFDARLSKTLSGPIPIVLSAFGNYTYGMNDQIVLAGTVAARTKEKEFERESWNAGITAMSVLSPGLSAFVSYAHFADDQEFAFLRSDIPRFLGPGAVNFFFDSAPEYRSDVGIAMAGLAYSPFDRLQLSAVSTTSWTRFEYGGGIAANVLDQVNGLRRRISSAQIGSQFKLDEKTSLGLHYRYDALADGRDLQLLSLDGRVQTFGFTLTRRIGAAPAR